MKDSQHVYTHPKTIQAPQDQWETTAWNAAWTAAHALTKMEKGEE